MRWMPRPIAAMIVIACLAQQAFAGPGQPAGGGRQPRLEDFLRLEELGLVRPSPDGRLIAVEIRRPRLKERFVISENPVARSDIWIVDARSRDLRRITNGTLDGSWYASPIWSPDGQRLALLAGDVEGNVRLVVWDSGTGTLGILAERSVDLDVNFGSPGPYPPHGRLAAAWTGDEQLLAALLPRVTTIWKPRSPRFDMRAPPPGNVPIEERRRRPSGTAEASRSAIRTPPSC